ncbi:cathepsin G (predicted), isoform CRA_b [Rattus norvegicus]|uniref:Cathepsin G (Predicted), isoform CRA_b n=1 Tax=Rattus norvegicus TaxID=10116 RepID=A6KH83_RAT|nr:cathepsin G (predicted), isoform CRA_b [Rattus norvegicus]
MQPLLFLLIFVLFQEDEAGKIIGGREARPNSHPYMAFLLIQSPEGLSACGGFLVREDFVLTAGHCFGSSINVTLGAHNIRRQEGTQQHITVLRAIRHPDYNPPPVIQNDIMLLQGDSGGPLVCNNVAQGIVSYGSSSGNPPAVFTRIQSFMPWIKRTMRRLSSRY